MNTPQITEAHHTKAAKLLQRLVIVATTLLVLANVEQGRAQSADDYVVQGRSYLAVTNLAGANAAFAQAVSLQPSHPVANVLYAVTRMLMLPSQPAGSNFLSRLGVSSSGRDIYNWTASMATDSQHAPIAPAGVNADETTDYLQANVLPELLGADANLAQVTDTNFSLALTSEETRGTDVILDYGDVQMLRAMVRGTEYLCYTMHSWNLDAQLTAIRALYTNNSFSIEQLLEQFPQLLTFTNTNDLAFGSAAFQQAVASYVTASDFIRARPIGTVRLFNIDGVRVNKEANFRATLIDLTNSMNGAVPLTVDNHYSVFLPAHFDGQHSPRSFLPNFFGDGFVLGSLPDASFGGLVQGLTTGDLEPLLAKHVRPLPSFENNLAARNGSVEFSLNTLRGRGYVIQSSTDLLQWTDEKTFVSFDNLSSFADLTSQDGPRHFFRAVDRTSSMPPPPNDDFANRIPLAGTSLVVEGYNLGATIENAEDTWGNATVWWSWTAPFTGVVQIGLAGSTFSGFASIYTGNSLSTLVQVGSDGQPFNVVAGTTYQIQVGAWNQGGGIRLAISQPPTVFSSLTGDLDLSSPTNVAITASASDFDGTITNLAIYIDGKAVANTTTGSLNYTWDLLQPGVYDVWVAATDNTGITSYTDTIFVTLHPANDNFSNASIIATTPAAVTGTTDGATKETGEPNHANDAGGSSVWWAWTAQSNSLVTIDCTMTGGSTTPLLGIYTGDSVSNLTTVASAHAAESSGYATVDFTAEAGVTYYIAVDAEYGYGGPVTLQLTAAFAAGVTDLFGFPSEQSIQGLMLASNGMFYGTTSAGGTNNNGTVFQMTPAGAITTLASFSYEMGTPSYGPMIEGPGGYLYGLTYNDSSGNGTIFRITPGGQLSIFATFTGDNGNYPLGPLTQDGQGNLYGTTLRGGQSGRGTVFKVASTGTISVVTSFDLIHGGAPQTGVTFGSDGNLYGMVSRVDTNYYGGVFRVTTNGAYSLLKQFNYSSDGAYPGGGLVSASGGALVGATSAGGPAGIGTTFKVLADGTVSTISTTGSLTGLTHLSDGSFYGALSTGGALGIGYIFKMNISGVLSPVCSIDGANIGQGPQALLQQNDTNIFGFSYNAVIFRATAVNSTSLASLNSSIGSYPQGNVVVGNDGVVYGITYSGGTKGYGTIYKEQNGTVTTAASFDWYNGAYPQLLSQDANGQIYGACSSGGDMGLGTIFRFDGSTITRIASFDGTNGNTPSGSLAITANGTVYGTTYNGGTNYSGNVFAISPTGVLTNLYTFDGNIAGSPQGVVQAADGNLYGTTYYGGATGNGIIYRITPAGVLTVLHSFTGEDGASPNPVTLGSDSVLYGTTGSGGTLYDGTVFKITTNGVFTKLLDFTENNGSFPSAPLVEASPGLFYGSTSSGGPSEEGTFFQISSDGTFTTRLFLDGSNGSNPVAGIASDHNGNLYTTMYGPLGTGGDLFEINVGP